MTKARKWTICPVITLSLNSLTTTYPVYWKNHSHQYHYHLFIFSRADVSSSTYEICNLQNKNSI